MSHFTRLKRLLQTTNSFQLSRLFRIQWRQNPAVAKAATIINAYKRRAVLNAQNADVAPTTVDVAYLRFMKIQTKTTHVLYTLTTDTFVHCRNNSLFTSHCSIEAKL